MNWKDLKNAWNRLDGPQKVVTVVMILFFLEVLALPLIPLFFLSPEPQAKQSVVQEDIVPAEPEETRFASESFKPDVLITFYQNGKWDGEPVRSYDGDHIASIMDDGRLIIDGMSAGCYPDLPKDTAPMQFDAIYRDPAAGTYVCFARDFSTAHHNELYLYSKGELLETYKAPVTDIQAGTLFTVRLEHTIVMSYVKENKIVRFDPRRSGDEKFQVLAEDMAPLITKVSPVKARFVITTYDIETDDVLGSALYEIGESGPIKVVKESTGIQRVRPLEDYPERGDLAEFWLLRTAYVEGAWDGKATQISDIAKALDVRLDRTPSDVVHNLRSPKLTELDYSNVDPSSIATISKWRSGELGANVICIDNEPRYYLHATAPWLANDISYRKIKNLGYGGFVEIDDPTSTDYFDWSGQPLMSTPTCYLTYATTTNDLVSGDLMDYASVAIPLPYYTSQYQDAGLSAPDDFVAGIDIIDAINYDNAMRAVAIGAYRSEEEDDFSLYLSRKNSQFEQIASDVVSCHFFAQYSIGYLGHDNYYAPSYDAVSLWIDGHTKTAFIDDIFRFDNTYQVVEPEASDTAEPDIP